MNDLATVHLVGGPMNGKIIQMSDGNTHLYIATPIWKTDTIYTHVRGPWWRFWRRWDTTRHETDLYISGFTSAQYVRAADDPSILRWESKFEG